MTNNVWYRRTETLRCVCDERAELANPDKDFYWMVKTGDISQYDAVKDLCNGNYHTEGEGSMFRSYLPPSASPPPTTTITPIYFLNL